MKALWNKLSLKSKIIFFGVLFLILTVLVLFFKERAEIIAKFKFLAEKKMKEAKIKDTEQKIAELDKKIKDLAEKRANYKKKVLPLIERKEQLEKQKKQYEDDLIDIASKLGY